MTALIPYSLIAIGVLIVSSLWVPLPRGASILDTRVYVLLFAGVCYKAGQTFLDAVVFFNPLHEPFVWAGLLLLVTVLGLLIAYALKDRVALGDMRLFFSFWFTGIVAICLAAHFLMLAVLVIACGVFLWIFHALLRRFNMLSPCKTLTVSVTHYDALCRVQSLLSIYNARIVSSRMNKQHHLEWGCRYRLPVLAHHVFARHLLQLDGCTSITIHDG